MDVPFMNRKGAAAYIQSKVGLYKEDTLTKLACIGGGPRFRKFGRVPVYTKEDLDAWIGTKLSGLMERNHTPVGE